MRFEVFENGGIDLALGASGLLKDEGYRTAVIVSLLTDRRADKDDRLPEEIGSDMGSSLVPPDRRGWCGDALADIGGDRVGSRLWLLVREKQTEETRRRAIAYIKEALQWLIDDRHARAVSVDAEWTQSGRLDASIDIQLNSGSRFAIDLNDITGGVYVL